MSDELLSALGLGDVAGEVATSDTASETVADTAEAATTPVKRTEIKIVGEIKKSNGLLPARAPSGGGFGKRESKYPFETLSAPSVDEAGSVTGYDFFEVKLSDVENADAKKLQGAIQAAVAAQNKKAKEENSGVKYVSRTLLDAAGAYEGSAVYRVDGTIGDDEE